jgi:hypothetical protein
MLTALNFLERVHDRARAEPLQAVLIDRLKSPDMVAIDPDAGGYVFKSLDFATRPDSAAMKAFSSPIIEHHLEALAARQQEDGGWPLTWEPSSAAATLESGEDSLQSPPC